MRRQKVFKSGFWISLVFVSGISVADSSDPIPGWNTLVYLMYKLEVANYCSATTERAGLGFQIRQRQLIEQYGFDRDLIESAQSESWGLAHKEWKMTVDSFSSLSDSQGTILRIQELRPQDS